MHRPPKDDPPNTSAAGNSRNRQATSNAPESDEEPNQASTSNAPPSRRSDRIRAQQALSAHRFSARNDDEMPEGVDPREDPVEENSEEINNIRERLPVAVVVVPIGYPRPLLESLDRIKVVEDIKELESDDHSMRYFTEGRRGHVDGQAPVPYQYPGLPKHKFSDIEPYDASQLYPIQAAYRQCLEFKKWIISYEGWTTTGKMTEKQLKLHGSESFKIAQKRLAYLNALGNTNRRYYKTPDNQLIAFEDVSYYHSLIQQQEGLGRIWYLNLKEEKVWPPAFRMTNQSIMTLEIYKRCLENEASKSIVELRAEKQLGDIETGGGCENPKGCVCNERFALLFNDFILTNLETNADGCLDLQDFDNDTARIAMECSDQCGCTYQCPRRQLQKGSRKDLVVNYEGPEKNYGLRALQMYKKGQLITEYTGILKLANKQDDASYQIAVEQFDSQLTIDSRQFGNAGRFPSHSCAPNAAFILVYSRRLESDPMVPRIGLYAIKHISLAEEICPSYYTKADMQAAKRKKKGSRCLCGSEGCCQRLP